MSIYQRILIYCCLWVGFVPAYAAETVRITNGEWQPFLSEHAPHYGFASHIVTEAFALVGVEVEYGFFPWKRSMELAKNGRWDGTAVWSETEERKEDFYYTDAVAHQRLYLFHLKSLPFDWNTLEDLRGTKIGGTVEYSYGEEFDAAEEAGVIFIDRASKDEQGLRKLLKGRVEVFAGEIMVTYEQARDVFSEEEAASITHNITPIDERPMFLLLSKAVDGNERLRDLFNQGLKRLKDSGRYDQIIADGIAGKYAK